MKQAAALIAVLVLAPVANGQPAPCRFDGTLASEVRDAAALALRVFAGKDTPRPLGVNEKDAGPNGGVAIAICNDEGEAAVAGGVCLADPANMSVRCSAGALAALVSLDRRAGRASPALLYVLGHELAHLEQKKAGRFEGEVAVVPLARNEQAKWLALRRLCRTADSSLEEAADAEALTVLVRAADLERYRDKLLSPRSAVYTITDRLLLAAKELAAWETNRGPAMERPTALTVQTFEPTPENLARTARRLLCQVRTATTGTLALPNAPGSHPDEPTRLAAISSRLREKAKELPGGRLGLPPEVPDMQPLENLIEPMGDIAAMIHKKEKEFYAKLWPYVCETYLNAQQWPDCSDPASGDGTPECPLFLAIFDELPAGGEPVTVPFRVERGALELDGRVVAGAEAADATRLFAVDEPPALVRWGPSAGVETVALPCAPAAITATPAGHTLLCRAPFGYVTIEAGRPKRFHRMTTARLNDERLEAGDVEGTALAFVGGRLVASAYVGEASASIGIEIIKEGARSLGAWRKSGCEQLRSGFALATPPGGTSVVGVTVSSLATTEVARFDANVDVLRDVIAPDQLQADEPRIGPTLACVAAGIESGAICMDVEGRLFDPFASGSPLPSTVPLSERIRGSRGVHGALAANGRTLFAAAWDAHGLELFRVDDLNARGCLIRAEETTIASLQWLVTSKGAYVITFDGQRSRVTPEDRCGD